MDHAQAGFRRQLIVLADDLKGAGLQAVADQHGGSFVVGHVTAGLAVAQFVVVHGRQIVVDQGVAVDHLHGNGRGLSPIGGSPQAVAGGQRQQRSQTLATAKQRIAAGVQ